MLGWEIYIRSKNEANDHKYNIARWTASIGGLSWLDDLVKSGNVDDLGGNGYPNQYSIKAGILKPILLRGIPSNDSPPVIGEDYYLPKGYTGSIEINHEMLNKYDDNEELIVTAWDLS